MQLNRQRINVLQIQNDVHTTYWYKWRLVEPLWGCQKTMMPHNLWLCKSNTQTKSMRYWILPLLLPLLPTFQSKFPDAPWWTATPFSCCTTHNAPFLGDQRAFAFPSHGAWTHRASLETCFWNSILSTDTLWCCRSPVGCVLGSGWWPCRKSSALSPCNRPTGSGTIRYRRPRLLK